MLGIFYLIVAMILISKMIYRSYLYSRGANVVITDKHYISLGHVVGRTDYAKQKEIFSALEETFHEALLGPS